MPQKYQYFNLNRTSTKAFLTLCQEDPYEAERIAMTWESQAIADEDAAINDERNAIQQLTQANPQDPTLFYRKAYLKARQNALGARGAQLGLRRKSWKSGTILDTSTTQPTTIPTPQNQQMHSAPLIHYNMSIGTPQVQTGLQQLNLSGKPVPQTRFQPLDAYGTLLKTPNDLAAWQQSHYPASKALQIQSPALEPKKITLAQIKQQQNNIPGRAVQSQKIGRPLQPAYYQSAVPEPVPFSVQAIEDRIDKHFSSSFQGSASKYLVGDHSVLLTDEKKQARDSRRGVLDAILHSASPIGNITFILRNIS
jgi:hypothetical protein